MSREESWYICVPKWPLWVSSREKWEREAEKPSKSYGSNQISASLNVNWNLDPKSSSRFCMERKTLSKLLINRHWLTTCLVYLGLRENRLEDLSPGGLRKRHLFLISQKDDSIWVCLPENSGYVCSIAQAWQPRLLHHLFPVIFPVLGVVASCILLISLSFTSPLALSSNSSILILYTTLLYDIPFNWTTWCDVWFVFKSLNTH